MDNEDFYTTKMLIEVTVKHQFDPQQGIGIVTGVLMAPNIPAVKEVKVVGASSNFRLHQKPDKNLHILAIES